MGRFHFTPRCCCGCSRCLACGSEEIEALGIDVTITGVAYSPFFGCDCDPLNGTWHLPFAGFLDDGRQCEFSGEFAFTYCGQPGTLRIRVSAGCYGAAAQFIDLAISFDGAFLADAFQVNDPPLDCAFAGLELSAVSWQALCDTSGATITLSAA